MVTYVILVRSATYIALQRFCAVNERKRNLRYKRRCIKCGSFGKVAANLLNREFDPDGPNKSWVTDISYVRTFEGFLYAATVLDLFSRLIIGWLVGKMLIDTWCLMLCLWRS